MSNTLCRPIRIAGTVSDSITDGPGLRFTLFTQGCPHHCPGCHNPQTWDPQGGRELTVQQLLQQIGQNPLTDGVTLSGGEPFAQAEALLPLAQQLKQKGYDLAVYTGYTFEKLLTLPDPAVKQLLQLTDVLVDGPFIQAQRSLALPFRGSKNQRLLDVPASLLKGEAVWTQDPDWRI